MMARSFSSVKIMSALVSEGFCNAITRRGYAAAAASQGVVSSAATGGGTARSRSMMKKEETVGATEKVAWVPDPVTGYYRPENCVDEIDAVELRAMLLKPRREVIN